VTTQDDARALKRARARAEQAEQDARRMRDQRRRWHEEGTPLTRAEFEAGVPCRGCGEPWLDGLGHWPALLDMTPEQRADHDREEARWRARHGGCRAHRERAAGSRTQHCGYCCPSPPLSAEQVEAVRRLLDGWLEPDPASQMVWEVTHTCGHTVRRSQHQDHQEWNLYSTYECQGCGGEIRGVISAVRVGPVAEVERAEKPAAGRATPTGPKAPSKAALRRRLQEAEAQAKALRIQLAQLNEGAKPANRSQRSERDAK
jgi:hypothetical protein